MIVKQMPVGSLGTNCYLLSDEVSGLGAVIDPGGSAKTILAAVAEARVTVTMLLLTHGHFDHTGAVKELREAFPGVKVYLHPADKALLGDAIMPAIGETEDYGEGDVLTLGSLSIRVLHTPGHTPGGVCLAVENVLFTGDTLFEGSMGRTDFPGGDERAMFSSLRRLGKLEGDYQVCPGHMGTTTLSAERAYNYYMREAMRG
ncbi:MAG TPA: MBL fold metallo-hydrolase [Candidatus Galloscillospira stercoripullorum]|nr:MBL fold metallo-hydrolase [Candidatus Galloscillospira stercoripullorum]